MFKFKAANRHLQDRNNRTIFVNLHSIVALIDIKELSNKATFVSQRSFQDGWIKLEIQIIRISFTIFSFIT